MGTRVVFAIETRQKEDAMKLVLHAERLHAPDAQTDLRITELYVPTSGMQC